jgi:serine/threonine-protein kinase
MIAGLLQADPAIKGALVVNAAGAEVGSATRAGFSEIAGPTLAAATAEPVSVVPGDRLWIRIATQLDEGRGELRILVDGAALSDLLMTEEIGRDAIIGLFDTSGRLIASSNVSGDAARFPRGLLQAGRTRATSGAARYDDTDPVIAGAHSRVQAAPWFVASIQPATTAERVAARMRRTGLLSVLVAVLLTGLFSSLGYVAIIRPIDEIARSQWKVARRRESSPKGNEIHQLREAFAAIRRQTMDREAIGRLFLSRYLVLDLLGSGGMGSVFRGWDPKLERPVAIKTVHMGASGRPSVDLEEQRQVLLREAVTVAKFNHPNLVAIYDVEDAGEAAFLAMEFVDGMSLEDYLSKVGSMRLELAAPLVSQIARGLEAAHQAGVIHCDIKPANILLGRDGAIKVTDFGIARSAVRATGNLSGVFGTPGYLPPEALEGTAFTPMADLFGVGAMFYELLTGELPHAGRTPQETLFKTSTAAAVSLRERDKSVPPAIDEIILGLLTKDPKLRRPASARELADDLDAIADKHGWKWAAPALLAEKSADSESGRETVEIPGPTKLG